MRSEQEVNRAIAQHADLVYRLCMVHLKNHADAEDVFQTVFLKYALSNQPFETAEHEKAWLIRVTLNACKDLLKNFFRKKYGFAGGCRRGYVSGILSRSGSGPVNA